MFRPTVRNSTILTFYKSANRPTRSLTIHATTTVRRTRISPLVILFQPRNVRCRTLDQNMSTAHSTTSSRNRHRVITSILTIPMVTRFNQVVKSSSLANLIIQGALTDLRNTRPRILKTAITGKRPSHVTQLPNRHSSLQHSTPNTFSHQAPQYRKLPRHTINGKPRRLRNFTQQFDQLQKKKIVLATATI